MSALIRRLEKESSELAARRTEATAHLAKHSVRFLSLSAELGETAQFLCKAELDAPDAETARLKRALRRRLRRLKGRRQKVAALLNEWGEYLHDLVSEIDRLTRQLEQIRRLG